MDPTGSTVAELDGAGNELREAFARLDDAIKDPDVSRATVVERSAKLGERLGYWLSQVEIVTANTGGTTP